MIRIKNKKLLNTIYQKKYRNTLLKKKDINYLYKVKLNILKIKNFNCKKFIIPKYEDKSLTKELYEIYSKKRLNKKDIFFITNFYKKYNAHLNLKQRYNKNLKKLSNKKTRVATYIYLGLLINKIKLNKIQILNTLLKNNDYLLINIDKINTPYYKYLFLKILKKEINLIKYYLNV